MLICKIHINDFCCNDAELIRENLFKDLKLLAKASAIVIIRSSYKERMEDALALSAEEGRDKLR